MIFFLFEIFCYIIVKWFCSRLFRQSFWKFTFYAAHPALMRREINFHVVFPHLLPRLLLAAATQQLQKRFTKCGFTNVVSPNPPWCSCDDHKRILSLRHYNMESCVAACHLCLNNLERNYLNIYIGCLTRNGNSLCIQRKHSPFKFQITRKNLLI